jgi:hypothetical protein
MYPNRRKRALAAAAAGAALGTFWANDFYSVARADNLITSFTAGDLVVLRGGDATNPSGGSTTTIGAYLDEYTTTGTYVGTIDVPQSASGSNNPLTITRGPGSHEGILTLSANGNWLTFGGYDTAPTTSASGAGISDVTLGEISQNASTLNTSTLLSPATVRASVTVDGNEFWVSNNPGLQYVSGTGSSASPTVLSSMYNTRALQTVNNTLITGSGSDSLGTHGVWQLGASGTLPTSGTPGLTLLTSGTEEDGTDFIFADEPGDTLTSSLYQGTYNVLYSVGGPGGGATINKYEYNGSQFVLLNSETPIGGGGETLIGVTDIVSGNNVDLYYTDNAGIYEIVDSNNAASSLPNSGSLLDAAPTNEFMYGVALAPQAIAGSSTLTWNNAQGNNLWDKTSTNWTANSTTTTYSDGAAVIFNDNNPSSTAANYNVTLNTTVSPSSIVVSNSSGNYSITGTGTIVDTGSFTKIGTGTLTLGVGLTASGLAISGGQIALAAGTTFASVSATPPKSNINISSLTITSGSTLDINNNHIIIDYTTSDPMAAIHQYLENGFNAGWNAATVSGGAIVSSAAAANPLHYGIGWADGNDGTGKVAGLSSGQIELKYTLLGDANLEGVVNATDFGILAANFGQGLTNWDQGNFTFGSAVNATDFSLLAANFGQGASGAAVSVSPADIAALDAFASANGLSADVPEPASVGILAFAALGMLSRCRRQMTRLHSSPLSRNFFFPSPGTPGEGKGGGFSCSTIHCSTLSRSAG